MGFDAEPDNALSGPTYLKYRRAKARPDPDFRYCSKSSARDESENSIVVTIRHGLPLEVCFDRPLLCACRRAATSEVRPV